MRDWARAFRRASFKGFPFWVRSDGVGPGRRVAIHEVAKGERPIVQEIGGETLKPKAEAYLASSVVDVEGLAFERVCGSKGAGLLIMPMDPPQRVYCTKCERSRSLDKNGYIGYQLEFVDVGVSCGVSVGGVSSLKGRISAGITAGAAGLSGLFS